MNNIYNTIIKRELILIKIGIISAISHIFFNSIYTQQVFSASILEGLLIAPTYFLLKFLTHFLFYPLKNTLNNLSNNVSFLNTSLSAYTTFVNHCDFCSLCNGIMETARINLKEQIELETEIDFNKLKYVNIYLNIVLYFRKTKISNDEINNWCQTNFNKTSKNLLLFSEIYLKLTLIEQRWCPFKRSKEYYYRNKDNRYREPYDENIYEIGRILAEQETITCNNCPNYVNGHYEYLQINNHSVYEPLLEYFNACTSHCV